MGPNIAFFPHQKSQEGELDEARVHFFCVSSALIPSTDIEHEREREGVRTASSSISLLFCAFLSLSLLQTLHCLCPPWTKRPPSLKSSTPSTKRFLFDPSVSIIRLIIFGFDYFPSFSDSSFLFDGRDLCVCKMLIFFFFEWLFLKTKFVAGMEFVEMNDLGFIESWVLVWFRGCFRSWVGFFSIWLSTGSFWSSWWIVGLFGEDLDLDVFFFLSWEEWFGWIAILTWSNLWLVCSSNWGWFWEFRVVQFDGIRLRWWILMSYLL